MTSEILVRLFYSSPRNFRPPRPSVALAETRHEMGYDPLPRLAREHEAPLGDEEGGWATSSLIATTAGRGMRPAVRKPVGASLRREGTRAEFVPM